MKNHSTSQSDLFKTVLARLLGSIIVLMAMFFLPAGTFSYWEAWVYLAILFIPMSLVFIYLLKNDPELLVRRIKLKEREAEQKLIIKLSYIPFILAFVLPGFDKRFGWSMVPPGVVVLADLLVLLGYGLVFLVFRENRYASRVVEVEPEQTVIQSGPYSLVRHPMYTGMLLLYILSPLALGSYWAMIPAALIFPVIIARIISEESILTKELTGYPEYMLRVRYRLVPGVW